MPAYQFKNQSVSIILNKKQIQTFKYERGKTRETRAPSIFIFLISNCNMNYLILE